MNRIAACYIVAASIAWLAACMPQHQVHGPSMPAPVAMPPDESGPDVARHIQERYNQSYANCDGDPQRPAFLCSGLLMRATEYSPSYHSWTPNPATAAFGVSFGWLRTDLNYYDSFPTGNGFIAYPEKFVPAGMVPLVVRCVYPRDAWTDGPDRSLWHVDPTNGHATRQELCQAQGVYTITDWDAKGFADDANQCAFDVGPSRTSRATVLMEVAKIHGRLAKGWRDEVIVAAWQDPTSATVPIEAFFHRPESRPDKPDPLKNAREDQRDYFNTTGRWVPIIFWQSTDTPTGGATFIYRVQDQAVLPSPGVGDEVARHLQKRYDDVATRTCTVGGIRAYAYACSGVVLRSAGDHSPPWVASVAEVLTGVTLTWVRGDASATVLRGDVGVVLTPAAFLDAPQLDVIQARCVFPDAGGAVGLAWHCRTTCQHQASPVRDASDWLARYSGGSDQCPFATDDTYSPDPWWEAATVRRRAPFHRAAEVVSLAWSHAAASVPVEAVYVQDNGQDASRFATARALQTKYRQDARRWVPIIRVHVPSNISQPMTFTYHVGDQAELPRPALALMQPAEAARPQAAPPEEKGADVVRHLQDRYSEKQQDCGSPTTPAFVCSGILLRSTTYSASYQSWMPNPATAAWGVQFSWLRQDANFDDSGDTANGFIVYPRAYADAKGFTKLYVRCGYPQDAHTQGPDRCYVRFAPCQDMRPPILTATDWMKHFSRDDDQCAFAVDNPRPATADAWMQIVGVRYGRQVNKRDDIVLASWLNTDPAWVPVEAFWYRTNPSHGMPDPLGAAQNDQVAFKNATGRWVPIIRWTPSNSVTGGAKFEYRTVDQKVPQGPASGAEIAAHLQSRYDDSAAQCGSTTSPAFVCSGIELRATIYSAAFHSWLPNPGTAAAGVASSWLRHDSDFVGNYPTGNGFVIYPAKYVDPAQFDSIEVRCGYWTDAGTAPPDRCRTPCQATGIFTAAQHLAAYPASYGCAFAVDKATANSATAWTQIVLLRHAHGVEGSTRYNEIILAGWPQTIGARMPLEAFFWRSDYAAGLASARADQQDFKTTTGRWVPVIRWVPSLPGAAGTAKFVFDPAEQAVPQP